MNIGSRVRNRAIALREIGKVTAIDHMPMDGNNHELDMITVKWDDSFVSYFYQKEVREVKVK